MLLKETLAIFKVAKRMYKKGQWLTTQSITKSTQTEKRKKSRKMPLNQITQGSFLFSLKKFK
jgi:hypothetical protein